MRLLLCAAVATLLGASCSGFYTRRYMRGMYFDHAASHPHQHKNDPDKKSGAEISLSDMPDTSRMQPIQLSTEKPKSKPVHKKTPVMAHTAAVASAIRPNTQVPGAGFLKAVFTSGSEQHTG